MTAEEKAEEISKGYHFLEYEPKNDDAMRARIIDGALRMHEWTKSLYLSSAFIGKVLKLAETYSDKRIMSAVASSIASELKKEADYL